MVACACERAASLSAKLAARLRLRSASSLAALRRLQRSLSLSRSRSSEGMPAPCCWRRPRVASFSRIRCNQWSKGPCPGSNSAPKNLHHLRSSMHVIWKLWGAQRPNYFYLFLFYSNFDSRFANICVHFIRLNYYAFEKARCGWCNRHAAKHDFTIFDITPFASSVLWYTKINKSKNSLYYQ